jgi:hypothetical protein
MLRGIDASLHSTCDIVKSEDRALTIGRYAGLS